MRKSLHVPAVAAIAIAVGLAVFASGQQHPGGNPAPAQASGVEVVVVDVSKIMNEHPRRERLEQDFRQDLQEADATFSQEADGLRRLTERLNEYAPGTQEFKSLEEEILRRRNELTLRTQMKQRDFERQQAQIIHSLFQEMTDEIREFAEYWGIAIVLRVNSERPNLDRPDEIQRAVTRQVVWHQPTRDITNQILERLQKRAPAPAENPRGATIPLPPRR